MINDYTEVTETGGTMVSAEAVDMVRTRYGFAARLAQGRRVLEVACGPGPGLGLLAATAASVVAGDYTWPLVRRARALYGSRVPVLRLDAGRLPFATHTFDLVVLFEAIYFLPDVDAFLGECRRVLAPGGRVVIATVNPEWDAFHPNHAATRYWTVAALDERLRAHHFTTDWYCGFPATDGSVRGRVTALVKRMVVRFNLMPRSMKGKEWMKRIAFGRLQPFPDEVGDQTGAERPLAPLATVHDARLTDTKVVYAVGRTNEP